MDNWK